MHRQTHRTPEEALEREPRTEDGREGMARAIDAILGLARDRRPMLIRRHMAGLLHGEGLVEVPMPVPVLCAGLFKQYGLPWEWGVPPDPDGAGGTCGEDNGLSRIFATQGTCPPGQRKLK